MHKIKKLQPTIGLLADNALHVDDILLAVARGHTSLLALVSTTDHGHLVTLADRDRTDLKW